MFTLRKFAILFVIISFVFPKAGTKINGLPLYLSVLLAIFFSIFILYKEVAKSFYKSKNHLLYLLLIILVCLNINVVLNIFFSNTSSTQNLINFLSAFISLFFLIFIFFQNTFKIPLAQWYKILSFSFWFLSIYGLSQKVFGDYTVVIPGLTAAYSEAIKTNFLAEKNNMIWGLNYIKLSSTYQNGNLFGVNYILISWFYFYFLYLFKNKKKFFTSLAIYILICIMTASATVIIGLFLSLFLFFIIHIGKVKKINNILYFYVFFAMLILSLLITINAFPIIFELLKYRLLDRDISQMGGRIPSLITYLKNIDLKSLLIGGSLSNLPGGAYEITLAAVFYFFGLPFTCFLFIYFIFILEHVSLKKVYSIGIITYLIISFSDGAFWLPPTSVNFSLLIGLAFYINKYYKNRNILCT